MAFLDLPLRLLVLDLERVSLASKPTMKMNEWFDHNAATSEEVDEHMTRKPV
jgi:hypothetical protein